MVLVKQFFDFDEKVFQPRDKDEFLFFSLSLYKYYTVFLRVKQQLFAYLPQEFLIS